MDTISVKLDAGRRDAVAGKVAGCVVMVMLYFFSYFQRVAVPGTIFNELQVDLSIPASTVAGLGSAFIFVYAFSQLFVGMLVDRFGGRRLLLIGGAVMCLGEILFPLSQSVFLLYTFRILTGIGASCLYLSIVKEVDTLFGEKNFSAILGTIIFFGYSGGLFGTLPFERMVVGLGWRNSLLYIGIISCAVLVICLLVLQRFKAPKRLANPISFVPFRSVLTNRLTYPILITGGLNFSLYFVIQTTLGKKFLQDAAGVSSQNAAFITFLMMLCSMVMNLIAGLVPRLLSNRRKGLVQLCSLVTFLSSVSALLGLIFGAGEMVFLVLFALFAVSSGFGPLFTCLVREVNSPRHIGVSVSLHNCNCYLWVAVFSRISGSVLESYRSLAVVTESAIVYPTKAYLTIFCGIVFFSAVSLVSSFFIRETKGKFILAQHPA